MQSDRSLNLDHPRGLWRICIKTTHDDSSRLTSMDGWPECLEIGVGQRRREGEERPATVVPAPTDYCSPDWGYGMIWENPGETPIFGPTSRGTSQLDLYHG